MVKSKGEWFDSHVEVIGFKAKEVKDTLRERITEAVPEQERLTSKERATLRSWTKGKTP